MPIKPENRNRYPHNWPEISRTIRHDRADNRCECHGECGRHDDPCLVVNHQPHPVTGSRVVLTVAHLNHTPEDCRPWNLRAMCQRCHLSYDRATHARNRRRTLDQRRGQLTIGGTR